MKLIHKGLILISVPLAFEVFFVFGFGSLLKRSMTQLDAEVHAKKIIARGERLQCALSESTVIVALGRLNKGPEVERRYAEIWKDIAENYFALEKLANSGANPKGISDIRRNLNETRRLQQFFWLATAGQTRNLPKGHMSARAVDWFLEKREERHNTPIQTLIDDELRSVSHGPKLHTEMAAQFKNFLLFGVFADLLLVLGLCLFFGKSIEQRLRSLMDTTYRLAKGADLAPPLKGNDELAQLDVLLHDTAAKLIEIERFKKQLVGVVCHELKVPLRAVQTLLVLVAADKTTLSEKAQAAVQMAERNCHRLQLMVSELLDVEIMSSGNVRLTKVTSGSGQIMQAAADMVRAIASDQNIEVVLKDCQTDSLVDPDRMIQVLVNLLSNAIKFSPKDAQIILEAKDAGTCLEFSVTDQGPGIAEDLHKLIFEVFRQADQPQDKKIKGTGMGLSISKTIVEAHGGTIGVESTPGHGCTFQVILPKDGQAILANHSNTKQSIATPNSPIKPWQMRIRHKGLVLIGLPLLTEILLVGTLAIFLQQANHEIERQSQARTVTAKAQEVLQSVMDLAMLCFLGQGRQEPLYLYKVEKQNIVPKLQDLTRAAGADATRTAGVKAIVGTIANITQIHDLVVADSLVGELRLEKADYKRVNNYLNCWRQLSDEMAKLATHEELLETNENQHLDTLADNLDKVLLIGLAVNLLSAIGLTVFLTQNITKRITNVRLNAERTLMRQPLLAAISGSDEITHLDSAFRDAAIALYQEQTLKQQLMAIASHELRTPMTAIYASLGLLRCGVLGILPPESAQKVAEAELATERLIALINDILDIEKMDAGKFVLNLEDVPVQAMVARAIACVDPLTRDKEIVLQNNVGASVVRGDADRLVQVLVNLISNAVKFSSCNEVVSVGSYIKTADCLVITVSDSGCGIPSGMEERIFEKFIGASDKDVNPTGTGLGLPISKAIVEQHGGTIGVESVEGRRATFWFSLPLVASDEESGKAQTAKEFSAQTEP